jgi:hypothetical protein
MVCSDSDCNFWTYESIWTFCRTPWTENWPDAKPVSMQDNTTQKNATHIHASSGIRTHYPNFRAVQDSRCRRTCGHWDRLIIIIIIIISSFISLPIYPWIFCTYLFIYLFMFINVITSSSYVLRMYGRVCKTPLSFWYLFSWWHLCGTWLPSSSS